MRRILLFLSVLTCGNVWANHQPGFSTAGFYQLANTGRTVYSMNVAWRFHKGKAENAFGLTLTTANGMWLHCPMVLSIYQQRPAVV
ncbi:MAG: hypothetical protein JEZ14_26310 [Marinilabiliaceae bacterium]|nr:hypothetical protein [Marinilabiliaceae bacterium]